MSKTLKILLPILIICIVGSVYYNLTKPTKINSFIASKIYKTPANKAFTDENFYKCVVDSYNDRNGTSVAYTTNLTDEQLKTITFLNCYGYRKSDEEKVISVNGLEKLVNITKLYLIDNLITNIDLSKNTKLTDLRLSGNQLTTLDVSQNTELTHLDAKNNQLINLDVSNNTELVELFVPKNQLNSLDIPNNITIRELDVSENQLTNLEVTNIVYLDVSKNQLTNLEVTNIVYLDVSKNQLTTLNLENNPKLSSIDAYNNKLTNIDVSNNTSLTSLHVYNNQLTNINLSKNASLKTLRAKNNRLTNVDVSNNTELTYLDVSENQLTNIDVSKNVKLTELFVYNNQLTSIDASNNTELTYLDVGNNQLTTIDVSNDISLKYLIITSNPFIENKGIYKNDTFDNTNSIVKLPKDKESILTTILQNHGPRDKVDTSNQGNYQYDLTFKHTIGDNTGSIYNVKLNLYIIEATSDKYEINAEEGYIYTTTDTDEETILSNINLNYGEASIENNKLLIKYDGELMKSFDIVNISSEKYDLTKEYIYDNDFNIDNVTSTNGTKELKDNKLLVKYNDELLQSYDIVSLSSEKYDLTKDYIFVEEELNLDLINTKNLIKEVVDNKLIIRYNDEIFESIDIVKIESNKYELSKKYIYTANEELDLNNINVINGQKSIEDNKLLVKYNDDLLKEYLIFNINFGEYEAYDGLLVLPEDIIYEELINNITTNGVTYKIFNSESEVTEGNISEGMIIKIYYEDEVIDEYEVTNEYLELDESLNIDNEANIIEKLTRNLKLKDFISLINTSGSIEVRNNNNELLSDDSIIGTGSKVKITLSKRTVEYTLSVKGDVTGNGQAKMADVMKIATHIIEGNVISGDAFERAADITGDGKIKMNDVMKLATFIIDGGEL